MLLDACVCWQLAVMQSIGGTESYVSGQTVCFVVPVVAAAAAGVN